jgi:hypothetical protein
MILTSRSLFFIVSRESFVALCPALSLSKQRYIFFVRRLIIDKCLSVKAVPETATEFLNQYCWRAIVSGFHSVTIT